MAAVALGAAAFMTLVLTHVSAPLAPLRLVTLAIAAFATWAFCDEMGMRKPLNRAAFVFFAPGELRREPERDLDFGDRRDAAFLLVSVLLWSVALKLVGAVGVIATAFPIGAIVVGPLVVGVGAAIGVGALLAATDGSAPSDLGFVTLVERIFGLWAYVAAWLLWRGYVAASPASAISERKASIES